MFTGIISEMGTIKSLSRVGEGLKLEISAPETAEMITKGSSVSINGACQSAVDIGKDWFSVLATSETISKTNLKKLRPQSKVNLELPLTLNDPLGGHLVSGHIDAIGSIVSLSRASDSTLMVVSFEAEYSKYVIEKGSISIDGISLTIFNVSDNRFTVSLIPETIQNTTLYQISPGDSVNLEFDMIGKYIERFLSNNKTGLTIDHLKKYGFMR